MAALKWAEFRALVLKALTDRKPDDSGFTTALAEYVSAKFAQARGDVQGYALHQNRYTALRRGLAGYAPAIDSSALLTAVQEMVRDVSSESAEAVFTAAVADYVRAQRDRSDAAALNRYAQARARLAGYATTQSDATLKAAVKTMLRDSSGSDAVFADAVTAFVKGKAGDKEGLARFDVLRERLAGYTTTVNDVTLQAAVRSQLSDGKRDDNEFARACALYIRSELAREVDARDDEAGGNARAIHESCRADYERARLRLAGYTPVASITAAVASFLPVDSVRANSAAYITALTTTATEDLKAVGGWIDGQIAIAKAELSGRDGWIDVQVLTAKADLQGLAAWISQQVTAAETDLKSLDERVQTEIRAGVLDLQQHIWAYQVGHTSTIVEADVTALGDGHASLGLLPEQSVLRTARIRRYYTEDDVAKSVDQACEIVMWADRFERMIDAQECAPQIALASDGVEFVVTPALDADAAELLISYTGLKLDFDEDDDVPFDEPASLAVAKFVNAALAAEWGEPAVQQQLWRAAYMQERTRLYLRAKRRAEVG